MAGNNGGVIGAGNNPTYTVGSGVWRPSDIARRLNSLPTLSWPLPADPSFASVIALYHFDTTSGIVATNKGSSLTTASAVNSAVYTSGSKTKFATASFFGPGVSSAQLQTGTSTDWAMGSGDFTLEFWANPDSIPGGGANVWDFRTTGNSVCPNIGLAGDGHLVYLVSGSNRITGSAGEIALNVWTHVAVSRVSGSTKMFVNGTQTGLTYVDANNYTQGGWALGNSNTQAGIGSANYVGYISEARITKGVGRYSANFTAPTTRFPDY